MEARALLSSSQMSRRHGALQNALAVTTYLNRLVQPCQVTGIDISAAVQFESAAVLWDQGEMAASINMLQDLKASVDVGKQAIHVGKPELLARLVRYLPSEHQQHGRSSNDRVIKSRKRGWKSLMKSSTNIWFQLSRNYGVFPRVRRQARFSTNSRRFAISSSRTRTAWRTSNGSRE